ncbi:MAG: L-ribulose-5-phosphate 4-epimerase [Oribacterium parvum]|uniref:L-ribulose-5-phosphate 4-epimerase n=1 Tax=Oribacterium parvum TaxID=1501329 RepID=A0A930GWZ8_9FIRM|nr:L-ribulose-5-phosphate 4-epimerase [Oribacterium parvum]
MESLKEEVFQANLELKRQNVVIYTWGNVSGITEDRKYMVIKPSGIAYETMKVEDMVVLDVENGKKVEGEWNPSSDTETHLVLYRRFPKLFCIVHTHSTYAVSFAQAGKAIRALGTTHADYFYGDIPCTRALKEDEVKEDYEKNTGKVIVECIEKLQLDPLAIPGILVKNHGPFTYGTSPKKAVENAVVLEKIAEMAFRTLLLNPDASMEGYVLDKHYSRKHGKNAYYGQKK